MHQPNAAKVVSFQSAYDSLNRNEQHARARVLRGGAVVYYDQYDLLSHTSTVGVWLLKAIDWIHDRFAARPAPNNCSSIAAGNRLDPLPHP